MSASPSHSLELRPATEDDVPLLLSFIRRLAEYEKLSGEVTATEELLRENFFGQRRHAEAVFAYADGAPVGFAIFFHNFSTYAGRPGIYLEDLFVDPEFRAHGIGRALLRYLEDLAVERGCAHLQWAVLDWNEPAIRFYRRLGAVALDDWTLYRLKVQEPRALQ
jgi:GNAT superfamily N-acetyltransferase